MSAFQDLPVSFIQLDDHIYVDPAKITRIALIKPEGADGYTGALVSLVGDHDPITVRNAYLDRVLELIKVRIVPYK